MSQSGGASTLLALVTTGAIAAYALISSDATTKLFHLASRSRSSVSVHESLATSLDELRVLIRYGLIRLNQPASSAAGNLASVSLKAGYVPPPEANWQFQAAASSASGRPVVTIETCVLPRYASGSWPFQDNIQIGSLRSISQCAETISTEIEMTAIDTSNGAQALIQFNATVAQLGHESYTRTGIVQAMEPEFMIDDFRTPSPVHAFSGPAAPSVVTEVGVPEAIGGTRILYAEGDPGPAGNYISAWGGGWTMDCLSNVYCLIQITWNKGGAGLNADFTLAQNLVVRLRSCDHCGYSSSDITAELFDGTTWSAATVPTPIEPRMYAQPYEFPPDIARLEFPLSSMTNAATFNRATVQAVRVSWKASVFSWGLDGEIHSVFMN